MKTKRGHLENLIPFSFFVLLVLLFGVILATDFVVSAKDLPQYSNVGSNTTTPYTNEPVLHYVYWTDDKGLSGYIFSSNYSGSWANDSFVPMTGTANWSNVTKNAPSRSGVYGWCIYANDSDGLWNVTGIQIIIVQNRAPQIALHEPENNTQFNNTQDINFNFTATDDQNTILSCSIYLDDTLNQTNNSVQNNTLTNFLITGISYGQHSWYINCTDGSSSNVSEIRYFSINDTLPPIITLNFPPQQYSTSSTSINFNWTAIDNADASLLCNLTIDGNVNASNIGSQNNSATNYTVTGFANGLHSWNVTCWDNASNINTSETRNFTVDIQAPSIYYNPNTDANGTYSKNWIFVNITCSDLHKDTILLNWNGINESFDNQDGDIYWENKTGLSDGTYTFYAWCNDTAGNSNSTETRAIIIDTTAPQVALHSPDDGLLTGNATIVFNCSAQDATNLANITLWLNSSGWHANETQVVSGNSNSTTFIKTFEQGTYLWSCSACDEFGHCNYSFVENRTFTIDLDAPIISYVPPTDDDGAYVARLWTYINVTVSDANNVSACWLEWDGNNESMTMEGSGQEVYCYINKTGGEGQHSYNVYANDTLNNIAIAGERTIIFDITPPAIENISITSITSNSATIIWQTNEPANSTINYGTDLNLSNNVSDSNLVINHSITLTGLSASTTYYFNITSCDVAGNCNTSGYYNFTTLSRGSGGGRRRAEERAEGEKQEKPEEGRVIEITRQLREAYYEGAIGKGDRLLFVFRYVTHYIALENVGRDERGYYINISIHSTPLYDKLYEGEAKTYDINSDKRPDILVEFLGLNTSSNSTLAKVRIYLLECICPKPSNWSECRDGKQSRVVYKCSEATNWTCVAEVEEKACERKEQKPPIKKKINYLVLALVVALFAILILLHVFLVKAIKQHRRQKFVSKIKFYKEKYM
jgi:hypothetical protein